MYNYDIDTLVSRLANGESQEDIAQEMSDALTQAAKRRKAEEEERLARENFSRQRKAKAETCAKAVVEALADYFDAIGESGVAQAMRDDSATVKSTMDMLDSVGMLMTLFPIDSAKTTIKRTEPADKKEPIANKNKTDWTDNVIAKFLASL